MQKALKYIIKKLCKDFNADYESIYNKSRKREVVTVRHIIYYFLKEETKLSWESMANIFNQNHANAMHGHKTFKGLLETGDKVTVEWYRLNEALIRKMIRSSMHVDTFLLLKKYTHYEIMGMAIECLGENLALKLENHMISETVSKNERLEKIYKNAGRI